MKHLTSLFLFSLTVASAQTVSVQLLTDEPTPSVLGSSYTMGQSSRAGYVYGPRFLIRVSYSDAVSQTLSLSLSGTQSGYELVWQADGDGIPRSFNTQLGPDVTGISGTAADLYYRNDGTLHSFSSQATRYQVGVKALPSAAVDLHTNLVVTVTLN
ncbi:hypothetical protein [Deinococcus cellulosilyticus]|uniref:Spore coat protein U domain-containing protein n=1 Tax=Deinococcus cellulosilyticus (strain DSM 18568 / NBRC 106333 / KACC 11606 / 5516J-15) TaxID=1223518 RepID=A0A511MX82_DEIC1|nr:hypothetical protein [Deinococcus cellulosilyticus]GEM44757.1 hypothetical protein DC3_03920 [Deinococcus cellulosilyticus NBRC 106333 = KACC 11606]